MSQDPELRAYAASLKVGEIDWDGATAVILRAAMRREQRLKSRLKRLTEGPENKLAQEILKELKRARSKFPGDNVTFMALVEEVGELATAMFSQSRREVHDEAIQVAAMAMRCVLDGDFTVESWRESEGLDPL